MRHRPYGSESRKEENGAVPEAQYMPMVTPVKPPITSELNKDLSYVEYTYDDLGYLVGKEYGNGVVEELSYDIRGARTGQAVTDVCIRV